MARFTKKTLDQLHIHDERSFRHVGLCADLCEVVRKSGYTFRVLPRSMRSRWDRALALNLTFWSGKEGGDVLVDESLPADVVAHVAWHHLASQALQAGANKQPTVEALALGESIASAFDVYLVGRLLGHARGSSFLESQVPAMAESAKDAGLSGTAFERLLASIAGAPEEAFEELRELLYDVTLALVRCRGGDEALTVFASHDKHRMAPLLHRHELSNWVLYARAYANLSRRDPRAAGIDRALRKAPDAIAWLTREWVTPWQEAPSKAR